MLEIVLFVNVISDCELIVSEKQRDSEPEHSSNVHPVIDTVSCASFDCENRIDPLDNVLTNLQFVNVNPWLPRSIPPHAFVLSSNVTLQESIKMVLDETEIVYAESDDVDLQLVNLQSVIVVDVSNEEMKIDPPLLIDESPSNVQFVNSNVFSSAT